MVGPAPPLSARRQAAIAVRVQGVVWRVGGWRTLTHQVALPPLLVTLSHLDYVCLIVWRTRFVVVVVVVSNRCRACRGPGAPVAHLGTREKRHAIIEDDFYLLFL